MPSIAHKERGGWVGALVSLGPAFDGELRDKQLTGARLARENLKSSIEVLRVVSTTKSNSLEQLAVRG